MSRPHRALPLASLLLFILLVVACRPSHRELLDKADEDVLNQRALLAKYIYLQIVNDHTNKDLIRFRALKGLVDVSLTQLFEYPVATSAMEKIVGEFENEPLFRDEIPEWRRKLSEVWRVNLQKPRKAEEVLRPLLGRTDLPEPIDREIGVTYQALHQFPEADIFLKRAWDKGLQTKNCIFVRELQLNIIQNFALSRRCDRAIEWTQQKVFDGCAPDRFSLALERANCLEISGDAGGAMKVYQDLLKENPKYLRAQYLLENIKKRERDKVKK